MPDLGISVLLKGQNFMRMLAGLGVALKISLISVVISIPLGIVLGVLMTWKNPITKAILRIYLEIVRIMPQMVLLFHGPFPGQVLLLLHRKVRFPGACTMHGQLQLAASVLRKALLDNFRLFLPVQLF